MDTLDENAKEPFCSDRVSVFALDRDSGLTVYTEMVGGTYHQISQDGAISLNPFDCDNEQETTLNLFMQILTNVENPKRMATNTKNFSTVYILAYLNSLSLFTENDVSIGVGTVG